MSASNSNQIKDKQQKIDAKEDRYDPNVDYSFFKIPHWSYKTNKWNKLKQGQCNYLCQKPRDKAACIHDSEPKT